MHYVVIRVQDLRAIYVGRDEAKAHAAAVDGTVYGAAPTVGQAQVVAAMLAGKRLTEKRAQSTNGNR